MVYTKVNNYIQINLNIFKYNIFMTEKLIKFVFNQTAYVGGKKYQSGDTVELTQDEADVWQHRSYGFIYKPRGNKKKKEK